MITKVKTAEEIRAMRISGSMLATVLRHVAAQTVPGITTNELNNLAQQELKKLGGKPAFLGYQGFPKVICISVNDTVVHGIPSKQVLELGDIVGLDFGVNYNGMISDGAISVIVGDEQESKRARELVESTRWSLDVGIGVLRDGVRVGDIGSAIETILKSAKLGIVRDLVGHGVGHYVHEEPNIPNFGKKGTGMRLQAGMTIAIEPMATLGSPAVFLDDDGWGVKTSDGSLSAHFEHTVLITEDSFEILTKDK